MINIARQHSKFDILCFQKKYSFNQLESYAYPSVVGYITANDADSRNFGNVEYILSGSGNEDFKIFNQQVCQYLD